MLAQRTGQFYLFKKKLFFGQTSSHVGFLFPNRGSNPYPLHWKGGVLTTE